MVLLACLILWFVWFVAGLITITFLEGHGGIDLGEVPTYGMGTDSGNWVHMVVVILLWPYSVWKARMFCR